MCVPHSNRNLYRMIVRWCVSRPGAYTKSSQMKFCRRIVPWCLVAIFLPAGVQGDPNTNVHTTWLWHLHQPVYWPDRRGYGADHYENAWDTIQEQNAGRSASGARAADHHLRPGRPRERVPGPAGRHHQQPAGLSGCRRAGELFRRAHGKRPEPRRRRPAGLFRRLDQRQPGTPAAGRPAGASRAWTW